MRVSHEQPTAKPVVGGCVVQRIVDKPSRDLFPVAPVRSMNGLPGVDIVVQGEAPNRMRQNRDKPWLKVIDFI